jgi:hypothetical protein
MPVEIGSTTLSMAAVAMAASAALPPACRIEASLCGQRLAGGDHAACR